MNNKQLAIKVDKLQSDINYILDELLSEIEQLEYDNKDLKNKLKDLGYTE